MPDPDRSTNDEEGRDVAAVDGSTSPVNIPSTPRVVVDTATQGPGAPRSPHAFVVAVDPTWEDEHLPCCVCGEQVFWRDAVLLPTATHEDGDITGCTLAHRDCPEATHA